MYIETTEKLLEFIEKSPTAFQAVDEMKKRFTEGGFQVLSEREHWNLIPGGKYVVTRNNSALIAFAIPEDLPFAFHIMASHSDSPAFKIKENPEMKVDGSYVKLNVEKYGGMLMAPWFDRPLSVAGRVVVKENGRLVEKLVNIERNLVMIPNLAIHLNREVNKGVELNRQNDLEPLAYVDGTEVEKEFFFSLLARELKVSASEILDYELYLYNCDAGDVLGIQEDMISAPRLDNITSVEACLQGLLNQNREKGINVIALFDNEEIGSRTKQGADSEFLYRLLKKIYRCLGVAEEKAETAIFGGFALSLDVAHGFHPNRPEKSDPTNPNPLGKGVVIKRSSAQNYVTDSEAVATAMMIFENEGIPYQKFASRSDVSQGGTLGSIASKYLPMKMVDMGVPILAMHSARELMAAADQYYLEEFVTAFFEQ